MAEPLTLQLVGDLLKQLHVAFPRNIGMQNPQLMAETYRNGLRGLPGDAVRWAVNKVIEEDQYFPKIARLRQLAHGWMKANMVQVEPNLPPDPLWCEGCKSRARWEIRWRPKLNEKNRRIFDEHGRMALETFERLQCKCSSPPRYQPDAEDDPWMTEPGRQPQPQPAEAVSGL